MGRAAVFLYLQALRTWLLSCCPAPVLVRHGKTADPRRPKMGRDKIHPPGEAFDKVNAYTDLVH
jgi:hypothetical protein